MHGGQKVETRYKQNAGNVIERLYQECGKGILDHGNKTMRKNK